MRNTYQIRKYLALALSLALAAGLLAGCSKSDSSKQDSAAGTGNTGVNASGNVVAGAGSNSAQTVQSETQTAAAPQQETAAAAGTAQNAQNVSGTTTQTQQTNNTSTNQTAPASTNQAPAASSSPSGTQQQNKPAANVDDDDEGFNGTFEKSDGEEKVQIRVEGSDKIRFVFRTSMINGTAKINGNTAQYTGDDDYKIIFDVAEDILMVTVEGEDGDLSDMNGIYYRDYGDDETEDDDAVFDGDETEEADDYFEDDDLEDFLEDETE